MTTIKQIGPKYVGETKLVRFDFSKEVPAGTVLSNPAVTVVWHSGKADANPSAIKSGDATVDDLWVDQLVTAGLGGARYALYAQAASPGGQVHIVAALLEVI